MNNWQKFKNDMTALLDARGNEEQAQKLLRIRRNQANRERNAAIREICGTNARIAKIDGGI